MAKLTRRGFLRKTTVGAATIGVLATVPGLTGAPDSPEDAAPGLGAAALAGPLVAHVSDFSTGEISLLVGTREVVYRDPELVARLLRAAQ